MWMRARSAGTLRSVWFKTSTWNAARFKKSSSFQELNEEDFLKRAAFHVEVLNHTLRNVPADRARIHICWGNYEGPHDHDIAFAKVAPILVNAKPRRWSS